MGLRFRRSVRLMPGVRVNFGTRGASVSLGGRGASYTIGSGRRTATVGIPGTGLSFSQSISTTPRTRSTRSTAVAGTTQVQIRLVLDESGELRLETPGGAPLGSSFIDALRRQQRPFLVEWLEEQARVLNGIHEALADTHAQTPPPSPHRPLEVEPFAEAEPQPPVAPRKRWTHALLPGRWAALAAAYGRALEEHRAALAGWAERRERAAEADAELAAIRGAAIAGDPRAMEALFERVLAGMDWPRETLVSFEVDDSAQRLALDIDLPEIEDLPNTERRVLKGELRVVEKPLSETECRRRYARHVHGVVFRAIGEAFARLPTVHHVAAAGYSQRPDKATGQVRDDYLLRIEVARDTWSSIDFAALDRVDPSEALRALGAERSMSKTGMFQALSKPTLLPPT